MATLAEKYRDIQYCDFDGTIFCGALYLSPDAIDQDVRVVEEWWVAEGADEKDPANLFDTNVITTDPNHLHRAPNPHVQHIPKPLTIVISESNRYFCSLTPAQAQTLKATLG